MSETESRPSCRRTGKLRGKQATDEELQTLRRAPWRVSSVPALPNHFEVASVDQNASSSADYSLLFVAIGAKGLRDFATKTA
jgi:hypothetical protein